jgi:hypothetical protein
VSSNWEEDAMKSWKPFWLARLGVFALAISIFAACDEDPTAPTGSDLDPLAAEQALDQASSQFFENNDAVLSLAYFGDFMIGALGADVTAVDLVTLAKADRLQTIPNMLRTSVAEGMSDSPQRIPVGALGITFVYNPDTNQYEPSGLTGAPENGVRFMLYAVDPILGLPIEDPDLIEVGHIDIVDSSSFPTVNIGLEAVINSVGTVMDVAVTGQLSQTAVNIDLEGYLSDGSDQLPFTLSLDATETNLSTEFDFSTAGFDVNLALTGVEESDGSISFEITDGTNIVVFSLIVAGGVIQDGSGIVFGTDQIVAMSGTLDNPTLTLSNGDLTQEDLTALQNLFEAMEGIFEFFLGTVNFALFLIILGLI